MDPLTCYIDTWLKAHPEATMEDIVLFSTDIVIRACTAVIDEVAKLSRIHTIGPGKTMPKRVANKVRPVAVIPAKPNAGPGGARKLNLLQQLTEDQLALLTQSDYLNEPERQYLKEVLTPLAPVFAFEDHHRGCLSTEVQPPVRIATIPHVPWRYQTRQYNPVDDAEICAYFKKLLEIGVLEHSSGPYAGKWLVFRKDVDKLRFIQNLQDLNKVTARDVAEPPNVRSFIEKCSGRKIYTILDLFSGYDQLPLDERDRDLTAMNTPLGLLRLTCLPQGFTNSVPEFQRAMRKVLWEFIPATSDVFVDDIAVLGARADEADEGFDEHGRRHHVIKHIHDVQKILTRLKEVNLTVNGRKAIIGASSVKILGVVCSESGHQVTEKFTNKVLDCMKPTTQKEARSFMGLIRSYRSFLKDFEIIAKPINDLCSKNTPFLWEARHDVCFDLLKKLVSEAPVLVPFNPSVEDTIYVTTDASEMGWGAVMELERQDGLHPVRFESGPFEKKQSEWPPGKRELFAIYSAVNKFRPYLIGRKIKLRTDSTNAKAWHREFNMVDSQMLNWMERIYEFNIEVEHIRGEENHVADALSRLFTKVSATYVVPTKVPVEFQPIVQYLRDGSFAETVKDRKAFEQRCRSFELKDEILYKTHPSFKDRPRVVVFDKETKEEVIEDAHSGPFGGHRGVKNTYRMLRRYFYWPKMFEDVEEVVRRCKGCQLFDPRKQQEERGYTASSGVWDTVHIDLVKMPPGRNQKYIVNVRDNLSGFVDAEPLAKKDSKDVARFLKRVFARFGVPKKIVADNGEMDAKLISDWLAKFDLKVSFTTPYHPQSNGVVERGHQELIKSLERVLGEGRKGLWPDYLPLAVLADNMTARGAIGMTPFMCMFGREPDLSLQFDLPDRGGTVEMTREEIVEARIRELIRLEDLRGDAITRLQAARSKASERWNQNHRTRVPLKVGDLVLRTTETVPHHPKFTEHWTGPLRISKVYGNGSYELSELSGDKYGPIHGSRIKLYYAGRGEDVMA